MPLVFVDLETTGLDPGTCAVLEVAAVVLPDTLELSDAAPRFHAVIAWDPLGFKSPIHPYVVAMHAKNGLWSECLAAIPGMHAVDGALAGFIVDHGCGGGERNGAQLAGNSVHFDRAFMRLHMPRSLAELHHRQLDVSSINELARRVWPDVYAARPKADDKPHRAMPDVLNSIAQARHYANRLKDGCIVGWA